MSQPDTAGWIDFQSIKEEADVERVLDAVGVLETLERRGDELVGWCPLGKEHGKGDSFAFNTAKKSFQCFACKARGSVLDFVRKHEHSADLREAAERVRAIMAAPAKKTRQPASPARASPPAAVKAPTAVMSFAEARDRVRAKEIAPNALIVIDATVLPWLVAYLKDDSDFSVS